MSGGRDGPARLKPLSLLFLLRLSGPSAFWPASPTLPPTPLPTRDEACSGTTAAFSMHHSSRSLISTPFPLLSPAPLPKGLCAGPREWGEGRAPKPMRVEEVVGRGNCPIPRISSHALPPSPTHTPLQHPHLPHPSSPPSLYGGRPHRIRLNLVLARTGAQDLCCEGAPFMQEPTPCVSRQPPRLSHLAHTPPSTIMGEIAQRSSRVCVTHQASPHKGRRQTEADGSFDSAGECERRASVCCK